MNLLSYTFLIFFGILLFVYYIVPGLRVQNLVLLAASGLFYLWASPVYGLVMLWVILVSYFLAFVVERNQGFVQKGFLALGIVLVLGSLVYFKYWNFLAGVLESIGLSGIFTVHSLALPAGISFFTLQAVGYLVDVYRGKRVERNPVRFALFLSFFPQILSGPIGRADELLPQLEQRRVVQADNLSAGAQRMLLGLFKKSVIADGLALYINRAWEDVALVPGSVMALCFLLYSLQLFFDFSGYIDLALGASRMLGISLRENFKMPYTSASITEFWSRWHLSLTGWYRDYLYIPLGGNRKGFARKLFNIAVVFVVSGLWHGAGTTFLVWGLWHAVLRCVEELFHRRKGGGTTVPGKVRLTIGRIGTFLAVTVGWVVFRAPSLAAAGQAFEALTRSWDITTTIGWFYSLSIERYPNALVWGKAMTGLLMASVIIGIAIDLASRYRENSKKPTPLNAMTDNRILAGVLCVWFVVAVLLIGQFGTSGFIYYQFN